MCDLPSAVYRCPSQVYSQYGLASMKRSDQLKNPVFRELEELPLPISTNAVVQTESNRFRRHLLNRGPPFKNFQVHEFFWKGAVVFSHLDFKKCQMGAGCIMRYTANKELYFIFRVVCVAASIVFRAIRCSWGKFRAKFSLLGVVIWLCCPDVCYSQENIVGRIIQLVYIFKTTLKLGLCSHQFHSRESRV